MEMAGQKQADAGDKVRHAWLRKCEYRGGCQISGGRPNRVGRTREQPS